MMSRTLIIADDHPMVRAALRRTLADAVGADIPGGGAIEECATFDELNCMLAADSGEVDLVLLDLDMPGMLGFVGLLTILANWPTIPVMMVSATEDRASVARARDCGASGFIPKSASMELVVEAVKTVLDGGVWFDGLPAVAADPAEQTRDLSRRLATLTGQQLRVLQLVLAGKLNKQIAGELDLAEQTVKGHMSQILRKLGLDSRTQVVIAVGPLLGAKAPQSA